jgi:hypothetical protein
VKKAFLRNRIVEIVEEEMLEDPNGGDICEVVVSPGQLVPLDHLQTMLQLGGKSIHLHFERGPVDQSEVWF